MNSDQPATNTNQLNQLNVLSMNSTKIEKRSDQKWPKLLQDFFQRYGYPLGLQELKKTYKMSKSDLDAIRTAERKLQSIFETATIAKDAKYYRSDSNDELESLKPKSTIQKSLFEDFSEISPKKTQSLSYNSSMDQLSDVQLQMGETLSKLQGSEKKVADLRALIQAE